MSIVVTGASGQFGRTATDHLLRRVPADQLILTTRRPESLKAYAQRGAQIRRADFDDPDSLRAAFTGATKMLLVSTDRVGSRVSSHANAIAAAAEAGVRHIAYTSFIQDGKPDNPALVVADHARTEELIRESGLTYTFLRNSQYADAVADAMAPRSLASGHFRSSTNGGRVAFVARTDCAECAAVVLTEPGHENAVYDITGPDLVSYREVAAMIAEFGRAPVEYLDVTDDDLYADFDAAGVPRRPVEGLVAEHIPWCSDDMVSFEQAIRQGCFAIRSSHVERLLGRPPQSLRDVLAATYATAAG